MTAESADLDLSSMLGMNHLQLQIDILPYLQPHFAVDYDLFTADTSALGCIAKLVWASHRCNLTCDPGRETRSEGCYFHLG